MSKYELSITRDYVPSWTVVDAVRELFQNALDQQETVEDNEMFFSYDHLTEKLSIGNKSSILNVNTLLLGSTTKQNDPNTIGQFGEGYKIATLVLTRLNKPVVFYNYGAKEVWSPRFVKSRRYGGQEILTFFVDKKYVWQSVPDNNLTIVIENINPEEYESIVDSNLHLQDIGETIDTSAGRILLNPEFSKNVYVNGLYVCRYPEYTYGYDFKPSHLKLDRDRKLTDNFELKWLASTMCSQVENHEIIVDLISDGAADVQFIRSNHFSTKNYRAIANKSVDKFKLEHGENAIPVTTQAEYEQVRQKYTPVFVSSSYQDVIRSSDKYEEPKIRKITIKDELSNWLRNHKGALSKRASDKLVKIIERVKV